MPRRDNELADHLSRLASSGGPVPAGTFEERLSRPSVEAADQDEGGVSRQGDTPQAALSEGGPVKVLPPGEHAVLATCSQEPSWIDEIRGYLKEAILPEDDAAAEKIARRARRSALVDGDLYRRGANGIFLKCISQEEGRDLLADVHGGECGSHASIRTLVGKAFRQGFYWPTALQDATELVRRCEACQFHAKQIHQPAQSLQTIPLSWPFAVWGLDILGPFPRALGGYEHLYVAIDKFTKWTEAEPVVKINKQSAIKFIRGLVSRFGVPNRIITDNGTQFTSDAFLEYCGDIGIQICFASVAHPRSNG